ncbi:MAG: EpsI family protein [Candidatus Latescibacteria bacterium]|nr:EpsI family protein [bacterium]MBD3424178.1 EpsI family protein [Candidatus Latescibacterota bacterium]
MEEIRKRDLVILVILLALLSGYTYLLRYRKPEPAGMPSLELIPERIEGYGSHPIRMSPDALKVLGSDTTLARVYTGGERELEFFLGFFRQQQKNSQIHSPKHCYPGSGWDIIRESRMELSPEGTVLAARSLLISDGRSKRLVIYWFNINGRFITNEFALKWQQLISSLQGRAQAAAFIRFSVILPPGEEREATRELTELAEKIYPYIERSLRKLKGDGA